MKETSRLMLSGELKKINRSNTRFREAVTTKEYQNRFGFSSQHPGLSVNENPKRRDGESRQGFYAGLDPQNLG
jgi:hypothetical protein